MTDYYYYYFTKLAMAMVIGALTFTDSSGRLGLNIKFRCSDYF